MRRKLFSRATFQREAKQATTTAAHKKTKPATTIAKKMAMLGAKIDDCAVTAVHF